MVGDFYEAFQDPYLYPDSPVLRNLRGLTDQAELDAFEVEAVGARSLEPPPDGKFDPRHFCALHRQLFCDVYEWAGTYRTVRMSKGGNEFCFPEHIESQMIEKFSWLRRSEFQRGAPVGAFIPALAQFLGELNVIHPFREGNGRTQQRFLRLLGQRAGHPFRIEAIEADAFRYAMIASFHCDLEPLKDELERLLA